MKTRLINIRLDEDRYRKVRALRERGVVLSDLVRDAIDARFESALEAERPADPGRMVRELFERYPDPADLPPRAYDVHDRRQAREAIRTGRARRPG